MPSKKKETLPISYHGIFEHEIFGKIHFVKFNMENEPWFLATDACKILGIKNVRQNLAKFPDDEKRKVAVICTSSNGVEQCRHVSVINEPGLYRLIFMSRKPEAEEIKRWVFHDVLPSIRKYGYYVAPHQELIKIKGLDNIRKFRNQHPKGTIELKDFYIDFDENEYGELKPYPVYLVVVHSPK